MPTPTETALLCTLVPMGAILLGGAVATIRPAGATLLSAMQHFAAGVVFAVVAVELLPDVRRGHRPFEIAIAFSLGVVVMMGLRWLTRKGEEMQGEAAGWPWGLLAGVGVDLVLDGLLLGIGFAAGAKEGMLLAGALTAECLSLGLAAAATLMLVAGTRRWQVLAAAVVFALLFGVGTLLGVVLLQGRPDYVLDAVLAFGISALLYLVTEELLVEAHEAPETGVATVMFFVGFLLFLILGMVE
ncbi:MAG: transporter [Planctomycetia bacterium]|nr:transporter [Planctomycetia bacterium]